MEAKAVCKVTELFLFEKLYSYVSTYKVKEDKMKRDIRDIIASIFGKGTVRDCDTMNEQAPEQVSDQ
jgi:hypothetical protein